MSDCQCGHDTDAHHEQLGRCEGECIDSEYGTFRCLCPYYLEEKI